MNREVRYCWDDDGSLVLKARLPAEVGALVLKALEARGTGDLVAGVQIPELPRFIPPDRRSAELSHKRADALARDLRELPGARRRGDERRRATSSRRPRFSGNVEAREEGIDCEIEDGPAIAAETARRLACDASVIAIVENEKGEPLSVGRKTRSIPPALQRALNSRDKGCRFPGCTHKKYTDAHHIQHWAQRRRDEDVQPRDAVSLSSSQGA